MIVIAEILSKRRRVNTLKHNFEPVMIYHWNLWLRFR